MRIYIARLLPIFFLITAATFVAVPAAADSSDYPLREFEGNERQRLEEKKPVVRVLEDAEEISLAASNKKTEAIISRFEDLDPNFLAEAFFVLPLSPDTDAAQVLEDAKWQLQDVTSFESIPYYSQRHDKWFPLFENMEIKSLPIYDDGDEGVVTKQLLKPFRPYTAKYRYDLTDSTLVYTSWNDTSLVYKGMRGVKPEAMYTALYAEARNGEIFFYGLGGANAFTFFGLFGDRLDQAFTGRVKAFFSWFYREFVFPRLEEQRKAGGTDGTSGNADPQDISLPEPYNDPPELK